MRGWNDGRGGVNSLQSLVNIEMIPIGLNQTRYMILRPARQVMQIHLIAKFVYPLGAIGKRKVGDLNESRSQLLHVQECFMNTTGQVWNDVIVKQTMSQTRAATASRDPHRQSSLIRSLRSEQSTQRGVNK
jgi:hypothetical protein